MNARSAACAAPTEGYGGIVTPRELELIQRSADLVWADADAFAKSFYSTLFEIAPETRSLFPLDLSAQRGKLVDELVFLISAAGDLDGFVERARELGRRHVDYGVEHADYDAVGAALLAAVAERSGSEWTPEHHQAWSRLYGLIANVMREGAHSSLFA